MTAVQGTDMVLIVDDQRLDTPAVTKLVETLAAQNDMTTEEARAELNDVLNQLDTVDMFEPLERRFMLFEPTPEVPNFKHFDDRPFHPRINDKHGNRWKK